MQVLKIDYTCFTGYFSCSSDLTGFALFQHKNNPTDTLQAFDCNLIGQSVVHVYSDLDIQVLYMLTSVYKL